MPGPATTPQNEQLQFVQAISSAAGLDPRVVQVWVDAEGAYAPNGTAGHNWLNLRPAAGDVGVTGKTSGGFDQFDTVDDAITSTINRLHNPFAGVIIASANKTPATQMTAIAASSWDSGHYTSNGILGGKLFALWSKLYPNAKPGGAPVAAGSYGGTTVGQTTAAQAAAADASHIPGVVQAESVSSFLGKLTDPSYILRGLQVLGGAVLVLIGIYLLARQVGLAPGPAQVATKIPAVGAAVEARGQKKAYSSGQTAGRRAGARREGRKSGQAEIASREPIETGVVPVYEGKASQAPQPPLEDTIGF
jgi:hypothetical protein